MIHTDQKYKIHTGQNIRSTLVKNIRSTLVKNQIFIGTTVQSYARELSILTNGTTAIGMYSVLIPEVLVGSSLIGRLKI
jgi:nucleoside diphosphate kinase